MLSTTHHSTGQVAAVAAPRAHVVCPVHSSTPALPRDWAVDANTAAERGYMATFVSITHKLGHQRLEGHST